MDNDYHWAANEIYVRKNGHRDNSVRRKLANQGLRLKIRELYDNVISRAEESPLSPGRRYRKFRRRSLYRGIFLIVCLLNIYLMVRTRYYCRNSTDRGDYVPIPIRGRPEMPLIDQFSDPSRIPPPPTHRLHGVIHSASLGPDNIPGGPADLERKKRLIFIGDIHGCMQELQTLLLNVNYNSETDHLVHTGDIIGKSPDSAEVINFLMKAQASGVRGNWEDRVLLTNRTLFSASQPTHSDVENDINSAQVESRQPNHNLIESQILKQLSPHHLAYLTNLPIILTIPALPGSKLRWYSKMVEWFRMNPFYLSASHGTSSDTIVPILSTLRDPIVVVHGGLIPAVPLDHQDPLSAMTMRYVNRNSYLASDRNLFGSVEWWKAWSWWQNKLAHPDPISPQSPEGTKLLQDQAAELAQSLVLEEERKRVKDKKAKQAAKKASRKLRKGKEKENEKAKAAVPQESSGWSETDQTIRP